MTQSPQIQDLASAARHRARLVLLTFLLTFIAARVGTFLIMAHRIPDLYLHLGGTHVHHLNYGIVLLAAVGAYLLFAPGGERGRTIASLGYGIGLALTFDEFGMWLHLGGGYWQRASFDAIIVLAALLGLRRLCPTPPHLAPAPLDDGICGGRRGVALLPYARRVLPLRGARPTAARAA